MKTLSSDVLRQTLSIDLTMSRILYSDDPRRLKAIECLESSIFKKLPDSNTDTKERALTKFLEVDARTGSFVFSPFSEDSQVSVAIGQARRFIFELDRSWERLYEPDPSRGAFGPGATIDGENNSLNAKLTMPLTYTNTDTRRFYRRATVLSPTSWSAEKARHTRWGDKQVEASKITTVPKDTEIDRVICIEPLANMFYQQAIRYDMERALCRAGIDIKTQQTYNRRLARRGSVTGEFATIDLSSASDTVSRRFCEYMLPSALFCALDTARSRFCDIDGTMHELNMMSTMGNATTFPLQTLLFLALVRGVYDTLGIKFQARSSRLNLGNCGVFGDDIIVVSKAAPLMLKVLEHCGMVPNARKTFYEGKFRESCGGDYYDGYNVRGVYIKSLDGRNDLFSAHNRLAKWSVMHCITLDRTLRKIREFIKKPLHVPLWEADDAGLHTCLLVGDYVMSQARNETTDVVWEHPDHLLNLVLAGVSATNDLTDRNKTRPLIPDDNRGDSFKCGVRSLKPRYQNRRRRGFCWDNPDVVYSRKFLGDVMELEQVVAFPRTLKGVFGGVPFSDEWHAARTADHST